MGRTLTLHAMPGGSSVDVPDGRVIAGQMGIAI